jgi:regulator of sigma E protease
VKIPRSVWPKLISKKIGETEYLLSAFPLGGYVKMFGEGGFIEGGEQDPRPVDENAPTDAALAAEPVLRELTDDEKARSFAHKPVLGRIAIVMAGPVFNLLFAWLIFIILCMMGVPTVTTRIGEALQDKPAAKAGMQKGDVITSINNKAINRWDQVAEGVAASKGEALTLSVNAANRRSALPLHPNRVSKPVRRESQRLCYRCRL